MLYSSPGDHAKTGNIQREALTRNVKILAFDTSTIACTVGLLDGDRIKVLHELAPKQQTKLILPMINELLNHNHLSFNDLDAVAYGVGPGSFTGIRIASCVAQAIGYVTELPLIPISSMATLAQAAFLESGWKNLLVSVDAREGHIYWAHYSMNQADQMTLIGKEEISLPEHLALSIADEWYSVGDAWQHYHDILIDKFNNKPKQINALQLPTAQALLMLARTKFSRREWVSSGDVVPIYLR